MVDKNEFFREILPLKKELENWRELSDVVLLQKIERYSEIIRSEGSIYYRSLYNNDEYFLSILVEIGEQFINHEKFTKEEKKLINHLCNIISRMCSLYKTKDSPELIQLMERLVTKKQIGGIIIDSMLFLQGFTNKSIEEQWYFLMLSINFIPKKRAQESFFAKLRWDIGQLPAALEAKIIDTIVNTEGLHIWDLSHIEIEKFSTDSLNKLLHYFINNKETMGGFKKSYFEYEYAFLIKRYEDELMRR